MSQLVLDAQLNAAILLRPLRKWITVQRLQDLRPNEVVLDERVPEILQTLKLPTFVTIDEDFCDSRWCNPNYCILYFALKDEEQRLLPILLRALFRHPVFRTCANRMGKVARISAVRIDYWEFPARALHKINWKPRIR